MTRSICPLLLTAAVLLASSCQSTPPSGPKHLINPVEAGQLGYRYQWAEDLGIPGGRRVGDVRVVDDLIIVVESPINLVTALSLRDGSPRWTKQVGDAPSRLYISDRHADRILVNSETHLYHLDYYSGDIAKIQTLKSPVEHAAVLVRGQALFGGLNGHVFAHDLDDGLFRWAYDVGAPIAASPIVTANNLLVTNAQGQYHLLTADGSILKSGRTFARISATPAVNKSEIYVASEDHTLYALTQPTLQDRWKYRAPRPLTKSPIIIQNAVYVPVPHYGLIAIDALTGDVLWEFRDRGAHPVEARDGRVLLQTANELQLVSVNTGTTISRVATKPLMTVLRAGTRSLILVSPRGELMRLDRD